MTDSVWWGSGFPALGKIDSKSSGLTCLEGAVANQGAGGQQPEPSGAGAGHVWHFPDASCRNMPTECMFRKGEHGNRRHTESTFYLQTPLQGTSFLFVV